MRPEITPRHMLALFVLTASTPFHAQLLHQPVAAAAQPVLAAVSSSNEELSAAELPDAPAVAMESAAGATADAPLGARGNSQIAPKYALVVYSDQTALHFGAMDKVKYGLVRSVQPVNVLSWAVPASLSQALDSAPHYGQGWGPFGQRYGAAAARGSLQNLATDAVFAPIFHQDPRYYELGPQHGVFNRAIYAATRAVITRTDSGKQAVNVSLLAGYAVAAGATNAFYPDRDRSAKQTFETYGGSVGGAAISYVFNEFLDDGLRAIHLRK